jgi:hypothetical protein
VVPPVSAASSRGRGGGGGGRAAGKGRRLGPKVAERLAQL